MIRNDLDHEVPALRHGTSFGLSTAIVAGSDLSRNQQMTPADLLMEPRHHSRGCTRSEFIPENVGFRKKFIESGWTTRPGGPGEPKNVAGGATPGRLRPPEGPDALGHARLDFPAGERG